MSRERDVEAARLEATRPSVTSVLAKEQRGGTTHKWGRSLSIPALRSDREDLRSRLQCIETMHNAPRQVAELDPHDAWYGMQRLAKRTALKEEAFNLCVRKNATIIEVSLSSWKMTPQPDLERQSSFDDTVRHWQAALATLGSSSTLESAKQIDWVRERAEDVCIAAESRLRIMLKKLPNLDLAKSPPDWFHEIDSEPGIDSRTVTSARNLVCAMITEIGREVEAKCEAAEGGAIEISWDTPRQLTWIISRPRMSWPGINVRAYARVDEDRPELQSRSFFLAHRAIDHAREFFIPA